MPIEVRQIMTRTRRIVVTSKALPARIYSHVAGAFTGHLETVVRDVENRPPVPTSLMRVQNERSQHEVHFDDELPEDGL
jgi:hypothetical protein